jgi:hypothetical protein
MSWQSKQSRHKSILKVAKAGYRIEHNFPKQDDPYLPLCLEIHALWGDELAGRVSFWVPEAGRHIKVGEWETQVVEGHRRKGVGTAMMVYAELVTKRSIKRDPEAQSEDAKALWGQPNRPFGNDEPAAEPNPESSGDDQRHPRPCH